MCRNHYTRNYSNPATIHQRKVREEKEIKKGGGIGGTGEGRGGGEGEDIDNSAVQQL